MAAEKKAHKFFSLKKRLLLIGGSIFLFCFIIFVAIGILLNNKAIELFEKHEEISMLSAAVKLMMYEKEDLSLQCADWGAWNETYRFVDELNKEYADANLNEAAMKNINVEAIALFRLDTDTPISITALSGSDTEVIVRSAMKFVEGMNRTTFNHKIKPRTGFEVCNDSAVIISAHPILLGGFRGSQKGIIVMVRRIGKDMLERLGSITGSTIEITIPVSISATDTMAYVKLDGNSVSASGIIYNRSNTPIFEFSSKSQNHSNKFFRATLVYLIIGALLASMLVSFIFHKIIDYWVVERIKRFYSEAVKSDRDKKLDARVVGGNDEITELAVKMRNILLASSFNATMYDTISTKFQAIFMTMQEGNCITDLNGTTLIYNSKLSEIFELDPGIIVTIAISDFLDEPQKNSFIEALKEIANGKRASFRLRLKLKNGKEKPVEVSGTPLLTKHQEFLGALLTFIDVSQLEHTRLELKFQKDLFEYIAGASLDGIAIMDETGQITFNNAEFNRILITDQKDDNRSEVLKNVLSKNDLTVTKLSGDEVFKTFIERKDGTRIELEISILPFQTNEKSYNFIVLRNINEKRRDEDREIKLSKLETIARLTGGLAHDFNNIMTVIRNNAELLKNNQGTDCFNADIVLDIIEASDRASSLTKKLLQFGRQEAPKLQYVNLNECLNNSKRYLMSLSRENIKLQFECTPLNGCIYIDVVQLEQIISNLLINSVEAIPDVGKITIQTNVCHFDLQKKIGKFTVPEGDYISLQIIDNGIGIDENALDKIFEPLYTTKEKGTGLGLASIYSIVKQNNGFICVESSPGVGTMVAILFQYYPMSMKSVLPKQVKIDKKEEYTKGKKILVVEDENQIRKLVKRRLSSLGYKVFDAESPQVALQLAEKEQSFDLLVTDVIMPGMNGFEFANIMKERFPGLNVIYISGYARKDLIKQLPLSERDNLLTKPFLLQELVDLIEKTIAKAEESVK